MNLLLKNFQNSKPSKIKRKHKKKTRKDGSVLSVCVKSTEKSLVSYSAVIFSILSAQLPISGRKQKEDKLISYAQWKGVEQLSMSEISINFQIQPFKKNLRSFVSINLCKKIPLQLLGVQQLVAQLHSSLTKKSITTAVPHVQSITACDVNASITMV